MSAALEPDQAVQKWRDQIEENNRLQHELVDQREKIEELARLNHEALFEASRFKNLYDITLFERDYLQRANATLKAKLETVAAVAADGARSIEMVSSMAMAASMAEPDPMPAPPAAPEVEPEKPTATEAGPMDMPMFLDRARATPLPKVELV